MYALITGGTSGIGKEMALLLLEKGYDLILVSRSEGMLSDIRTQFPDKEILFYSYDLSKEENCFDLLEKTKDMDIELYINNAGFGDIGKMENTSLEKEIEMVKLNDIASLIFIKSFLLRFLERGHGRVLSVCSAASFGAAGYMNVYYATKAFVYSLSHGYHRELRDKKSKVTISMLCPGPVKTGFEKRANCKFSFSVASPEKIALYAIPRYLRGKLVIVPGVKMKIAHLFSHFVPKRVISKVLNKQAEIK